MLNKLISRVSTGCCASRWKLHLRVVLLESSDESGHEVGAHSLAGAQADHPSAGQPEVLHGLARLTGHLQ